MRIKNLSLIIIFLSFLIKPAFANFDDDEKITINTMISSDDGTRCQNIKEYAQRDTVMDIAGDIGVRLLEYYNKSLKRTVNS